MEFIEEDSVRILAEKAGWNLRILTGYKLITLLDWFNG